MAEWLEWQAGNCWSIGAIGSSPSNGLKPNLWGQKGFNPLCQCVYVYVYVCIVNSDLQNIHRCSHTSIHIYIQTDKHTLHYITLHAHLTINATLNKLTRASDSSVVTHLCHLDSTLRWFKVRRVHCSLQHYTGNMCAVDLLLWVNTFGQNLVCIICNSN